MDFFIHVIRIISKYINQLITPHINNPTTLPKIVAKTLDYSLNIQSYMTIYAK